MSNIKKLLLFIIFIIFSYILYQLTLKRYIIKSEMENFSINPFRTEQQKIDDEFNSIKKKTMINNISNFSHPSNIPPLKLKEFCILSSFNTANTGKYVNVDMIKHTIERGFRFMDFEIFADDDVPYIGNEIVNKIPLIDVFNTIIHNAFSTVCPNYNDPLFVHLRIRDIDKGNNKLYAQIKYILSDNIIKQYLYNKQITGNTKLSDLYGKLIVVLNSDDSICENMTSPCNTIIRLNGLSSNRNLSNNGVILTTEYYRLLDEKPTRPTISNNLTTVQYRNQMQLVIPNSGINPVIKPLVCDYCIQIIGNQLHLNDTNLDVYEKAFNANNSAFVPLAKMIPYLESPENND